jgi:Transcriptional regulator containing an amidase domain and an AraC-type DNA-binding HTH domain
MGVFMKLISLNYFTTDTNFPFFIQYGTHDQKMVVHSHADFSELVIVLDGNATHIVANEKFQIHKGDVFVISNDTVHGYEDAIDFKICNIMFRMDHIFSKRYDIWNLEGFHALFVIEPYLSKDYLFQSHLKLPLPQLSRTEELIKHMIEEYENKLEGWETFIQANFITLALELSRSYQINSATDNHHLIDLIKPVSYIEKHYAETITIDSLAQQANISSRQLSRLFQEVYHCSPGNYLLHFRIQKAKSILCYSKDSICNIAYQCGFNDSNYFSRQFQKQTGITPSQYRKIYNYQLLHNKS